MKRVQYEELSSEQIAAARRRRQREVGAASYLCAVAAWNWGISPEQEIFAVPDKSRVAGGGGCTVPLVLACRPPAACLVHAAGGSLLMRGSAAGRLLGGHAVPVGGGATLDTACWEGYSCHVGRGTATVPMPAFSCATAGCQAVPSAARVAELSRGSVPTLH